jgi:hypothetical protein
VKRDLRKRRKKFESHDGTEILIYANYRLNWSPLALLPLPPPLPLVSRNGYPRRTRLRERNEEEKEKGRKKERRKEKRNKRGERDGVRVEARKVNVPTSGCVPSCL